MVVVINFINFLKILYPEAEPYFYDSNKDHIVTKINNIYYDITGEIKGNFLPLSNEDKVLCEGWSFCKLNWLYKECPTCGEQIKG